MTEKPKRVVYDSKTKAVFKVPQLRVTNKPTYASEFFANNGQQKPWIAIPTGPSPLDLGKLRAHIIKRWDGNNTVEPETIVYYLYHVLQKDKQTLDKDWVSFSVKIGSAQEEITPISLFNKKDAGKIGELSGDTKEADQSAALDRWILLVIFGTYRVYEANKSGTYPRLLEDRLRELARSLGTKVPPNSNVAAGWSKNDSFLAIMGVCDMFWNYFPDSDYALARFGTIVTRTKDSAMINSVSHMANFMGIEFEDIMDWIFDRQVGNEWRQMFSKEEELSKPESYVHYISSLKLAKKSPYSATECPRLHNWIHMVCSLLGSTRSMNARIPAEMSLVQLKVHATLMAYAYRNLAESFKEFHVDQQEVEIIGGDELGTNQGDTSGELGFIKFVANSHRLTKEQEEFFNERVKPMANSRPGTIGEWLHKNRF